MSQLIESQQETVTRQRTVINLLKEKIALMQNLIDSLRETNASRNNAPDPGEAGTNNNQINETAVIEGLRREVTTLRRINQLYREQQSQQLDHLLDDHGESTSSSSATAAASSAADNQNSPNKKKAAPQPAAATAQEQRSSKKARHEE